MSIIREYHHVVADQFYKGLGVALMRKESDVMVELLLELKRQHIVALPIHDGVLVADGVHEQTIEIMKIVFEEYVCVAGVVNIKDWASLEIEKVSWFVLKSANKIRI